MVDNVNSQSEIRVAIRFNTTNVPGEPLRRGRQIATEFARLMLNRDLSHDDFVHLPADFYSNTSQMLYILCDFNIRDRIVHVENVKIEFWKVTYDMQQSPNFVKRRMNGKHVANRFPWAGRDNEWKYRLEQRGINRKSTTSTTLPSSSKTPQSLEEIPTTGRKSLESIP
ncbi:hypothetical protein BKA65DRAFT_196985 [Rhexocercosporidium sp. MPI-PUGE-AT-0058]|nr:hypothetical protein BKA65DRAFT_196985 [Rhexocercosporidium sp. MPI-PUGE-AT-0058]